jgi:hypothetical protein
MKLLTLNRFYTLAVLLLFSVSCASDLDFEQVNTFKLEPVVVTNLAYFDAKASQFVDNQVERNIIFESSTMQIFNDSFFRRRVKKVELFFELENIINRSYAVNILFFDNVNQPVHALNLAIPAYYGTENKTTKTDIFEGMQLDLLKRTTKITFVIVMRPGQALTESSLGSLKLRSSVTAYLVVE